MRNLEGKKRLIKEKYLDTNGIATEDPEVLFGFYNSQRKTVMLI
jgi:hypothetical protein